MQINIPSWFINLIIANIIITGIVFAISSSYTFLKPPCGCFKISCQKRFIKENIFYSVLWFLSLPATIYHILHYYTIGH